MKEYKIFFRNGSTDIYSAKSAAQAREKAQREFGSPISKVQVLEPEYENEEDEEDTDTDADDEDDE